VKPARKKKTRKQKPHLIVNGEIEKKIKEIKDNYKDSELYKAKNYFSRYSRLNFRSEFQSRDYNAGIL
jgi:hypothetical protein